MIFEVEIISLINPEIEPIWQTLLATAFIFLIIYASTVSKSPKEKKKKDEKKLSQEKLDYINEIKQYVITLEKKWSEEELKELETFDETQLMYEASILRMESISSRKDYIASRNTLIHQGFIKDRYKFNEDRFLELDNTVKHIFEKIGSSIPKCESCSCLDYEFKKINKKKLSFQCSECNNVINITPEIVDSNDLKIDFDSILSSYILNLKEVFEYHSYSEDLIQFFSDKFYTYNPTKERISGIRIKANPDLIFNYEELNEEKSQRSRRISSEVQDRVWRRDEGKCVKCGSNEKLEFDHIIPFSKGGANTYRNIQLLCEKCNRVKSDNF